MMRPWGYCVIGLEQISPGRFRSVRPMPKQDFAVWPESFSFRRGDCVRFGCRPVQTTRPHVEDLQSFDLVSAGHSVSEQDLIECLRKAEVAQNLEELFGCTTQARHDRGALWVNPADASRSICGCEYINVRFRLWPDPTEMAGFKLRAELTLAANERVPSIPVVDREWHRFFGQLCRRIGECDPHWFSERFLNCKFRPERWPEGPIRSFTEQFLNGRVRKGLLADTRRFVRIGLARLWREGCYLMLDSLFPQPKESWLDLP